MNKKIQVAKYYDKVNTHYKEIDYENDLLLPELSPVLGW